MYRCYFRDLETGKEFSKEYESPYEMNKFLNKLKYSKKLKCIGKVKLY